MPVCVYDMLSILLQARSYDPSDYKPGVKVALLYGNRSRHRKTDFDL